MTRAASGPMELGVCTFAEGPLDPERGRASAGERRFAELMHEMEIADRIGLDVFAIGEHHRPDFAVSAPAVALAAVGVRQRSNDSV